MSDPRDDRAPADSAGDRGDNSDEYPDIADGTGSDGLDEAVDHDGETNRGQSVPSADARDSDTSTPQDDRTPERSSPRDGETVPESVQLDDGFTANERTAQSPESTDQARHHSESSHSHESGPRTPAQTRQPSRDGGNRWKHFLQYASDIVSSVLIVVLIGALLFATSGVWPPLVAIESPSMEPHIDTGDLVFVMDEQRFSGPGAVGDSGIVSAHAGEETGFRMFEGYGDVIIYEPNGNGEATPIIHRAMFWVENGENWYDRADPTAIGTADDCAQLANCPAPHAGFITKGDNNQRYDQVGNQFSGPVKPEWVIGTAEYGVPGLGQVRLLSGEMRSASVTGETNATNVMNPTDSLGVSAIAP